jgi:hypothetical protein
VSRLVSAPINSRLTAAWLTETFEELQRP